jgi:hypothetical protein
MKKETASPTPEPSPAPAETVQGHLPGALEASEITVVLDSEQPEPETSTVSMPIRDLPQGKTADIAPALLPDAKPELPKPSPARPASRRALWAGVVLCLLAAGGGAAYWFLRPEPEDGVVNDVLLQPAPEPVAETVPPEIRPYMDQARGGDARAMHMIALMYWNGLNVRQDRAKGLEWYKKAAAAGDAAAQKELAVIEGK